MHSGKQTHSEGQCRQWSAVYYTGGPKAESPLSQGPRPAFVKIFYTPCVRVQTHHPKFLEIYKGRDKYNHNNPVIYVLCVQTVNNQYNLQLHSNQLITNKPVVIFRQTLSGGRGDQCLFSLLQDSPAQSGVLSFHCHSHRR